MISDAREENLEDKSPVIQEGDAGHLQVHGQVAHVGLQLGKGLLALAAHVVLQGVHLDIGQS